MKNKTLPNSIRQDERVEPVVIYYGINNDGRYKVEINGRRALINGAQMDWRTDGNGRFHLDPSESRRTAGYMASPNDTLIVAVNKTDKTDVFVILGKVKFLEVKPSVGPADTPPKAVATLAETSEPANTIVTTKPRPTKQQTLAAAHATLILQRESGLDPDCGMAITCALVNHSPATIYRRMSEGKFPKSFKRGGRTFWAFSHLEKYRAEK